MTKLSVNLNKVAWARNTRPLDIPNVLAAAHCAIAAGAHGITVHPRPDERHIRQKDVRDLKGAIAVELNVEGNPFPEFMSLVTAVKPDQCTLVPDTPEQNTSDHGWDLKTEGERVAPLVESLRKAGIRVSLFLDPDCEQVELAKKAGAHRVELYTEPYASAFARGEADTVLGKYVDAARLAADLGLGVNAGHDLSLDNLGLFLERVPNVLEVSIGHALIADALFMGLFKAVRAYLDIVEGR